MHGRVDAMVDIAYRNAVVTDVVPDAKHTAVNLRIALGELLLSYLGGCPCLIEILAVEIVIVIACGGYDLDVSVRNSYHVVT